MTLTIPILFLFLFLFLFPFLGYYVGVCRLWPSSSDVVNITRIQTIDPEEYLHFEVKNQNITDSKTIGMGKVPFKYVFFFIVLISLFSFFSFFAALRSALQ